MTTLLDDNTYEALRRDLTSCYKKKVLELLQQLEKDKIIDRAMYHRLYPGEAPPCIYGLPKGSFTLAFFSSGIEFRRRGSMPEES